MADHLLSDRDAGIVDHGRRQRLGDVRRVRAHRDSVEDGVDTARMIGLFVRDPAIESLLPILVTVNAPENTVNQSEAPMLVDSGRRTETDKRFTADVTECSLSNRLFVRLVAKGRTFRKVDFKYSVFDGCYLRNCTFDSCDFTGCRFVNTNMHGAKFSGSNFQYASFDKTIVDASILDTECPGPENLKARFARSLRTNYQQLGDAAGVNKAMKVELEASEAHLHKAWASNESYYRQKYKGLDRLSSFFQWLEFKILDYVWGNGERPLRLCFSVFVFLVFMAVIDVTQFGDPRRVDSYFTALGNAPAIFLGLTSPASYPKSYLTGITFVRLVALGFFLSIIIKRFNRR